MCAQIFQKQLKSETQTHALAQRIAMILRAGDVILLEGEIGAGKSSFSRGVIRALCGPNEEVPSPTFTLVQVYETAETEIWHADLYRLSDPQEIVELGLLDAFDAAICLIEWPDRLGDLRPKGTLTLSLQANENSHQCTASGNAEWAARLDGLDD